MDNGFPGGDSSIGSGIVSHRARGASDKKAMRLYIIVDPMNHVFQLGLLTPLGLMPLREFPIEDFQELRDKVNTAWDLYQRSVLRPTIIQDIESIEALDKI